MLHCPLRAIVPLLIIIQVVRVAAQNTVLNVIQGEDDLGIFEGAAIATGADLTSTNITVFAPTDTAFGMIDSKFFETDWIGHLTFIVQNHIVAGPTLSQADLTDGLPLQTQLGVVVGGNVLVVSTTPSLSLTGGFGSATVTETDLTADNGVVHKVDTVMIPSPITDDLVSVLESAIDAEGNGVFSIFLELLDLTGLTDTVTTNDVTVLAPIDAAISADADFLAFLRDPANLDATTNIISNLIIPGPDIYPGTELAAEPVLTTALGDTLNVQTIADGYIISTPGGNQAGTFVLDGFAANGVAHAVNGFILPDSFVFPTAPPTLPATDTPTQAPTDGPTPAPTGTPTDSPVAATGTPTQSPTLARTTGFPTVQPTTAPTIVPTISPTGSPTISPTGSPVATTAAPSGSATGAPSIATGAPTTGAPTITTEAPTEVTASTTGSPLASTDAPTTGAPTIGTGTPTGSPPPATDAPVMTTDVTSESPSSAPTTSGPLMTALPTPSIPPIFRLPTQLLKALVAARCEAFVIFDDTPTDDGKGMGKGKKGSMMGKRSLTEMGQGGSGVNSRHLLTSFCDEVLQACQTVYGDGKGSRRRGRQLGASYDEVCTYFDRSSRKSGKGSKGG